MGFAKRYHPDHRVRSQYDQTKSGERLSINRQPRESLRPWVAYVYGMEINSPVDFQIACSLFSDCAVLRVVLHGDWHAAPANGSALMKPGIYLYGPQSKRMPVTANGPGASIGLALRPGVFRVLNGPETADTVDCIFSYAELGMDEQSLMARFDPEGTVAEWMNALEDCVEELIDEAGTPEPSATAAGFYHLSLEDPTMTVVQCAKQLGVEKRTLERLVKRDFGLTPKKVLRRARALDMAAHLRGVADFQEAQELALRYFDQAHLGRDFTDMFGMTPLQFVRTPQPLLTVTLESRQARRLEELDRLPPGAKRPWQ